MILLIMLLLFGQAEDTLSIQFVEESGSAVEIDGRIRHITYYDEEPGREPDTTWSEIKYVIDPNCGGAGVLLGADGNPLSICFREDRHSRHPYWNDGDRTYGYFDENRNWVRVTEPPTWWEDHGIEVIALTVFLFLIVIVLRWGP